MGDYGGGSQKSTWLYSNYAFITRIGEYRPAPSTETCTAQLSRRRLNARGMMVTDGGVDLKASQHYPVNFGRAVAMLYAAHRSEVRAEGTRCRERARAIAPPMTHAAADDPWLDAKLDGCVSLLTRAAKRARPLGG